MLPPPSPSGMRCEITRVLDLRTEGTRTEGLGGTARARHARPLETPMRTFERYYSNLAARARWSRRRCAILAVFFAVALVACNDSTTEPAEPLTLEETAALYQGLSELARDTTAEVISRTFDGVVLACPLGGQVTALVDFREEMAADTARLISDIMLDPDGCVLSSEGYEFTLDGNPNVQIDLTLAIVGSTFEFLIEGSTTGGVDWQLEDRSGICMIDLTLAVDSDLSGAEPMVKAVVSGTMCGLEVEFDQEVGVTGTSHTSNRRWTNSSTNNLRVNEPGLLSGEKE